MNWEYDSILLSDTTNELQLLATLDDLGELGWELVAVTKAAAYLKRPIFDGETLTATISNSSFDNFEEVVEKGIKFIERAAKVAQTFILE